MDTGRKSAALKLKTARGQIEGILKMLEDERYCIDISTQISSVMGLLKNANMDLLDSHLRNCVTNSIIENDDPDEKITEIIYVLERYMKI